MTGMQATTDTDYVVVGQPPEGTAERELFELQLKEADTIELPQVSANDLMRRVGGSEVNTQGPYKSNDNDRADSGSMDEDDDDAISTGDTTGGRDSDNRKKAGNSSEDERSDGERAYDEEYYQDSDGVQCRRDRPRSDSDSETDGSVSGEEIDIRGVFEEGADSPPTIRSSR